MDDAPATCSRCVMGPGVNDLGLNQEGLCRFCREFDSTWSSYLFTSDEQAQNLERMGRTLRRPGHRYDVILGISGGVDSSYVALLAHRLGLRALLFHFDNGWNGPTAVQNVSRIIDVTGFDLETYVIDWDEFRDLQRAYFKAGVIDIEVPTDHAILATMLRFQRAERIPVMLSGSNHATEHGLPREWIWAKYDWANLRDIHRRHGEVRLRTFPHTTTLRYVAAYTLGLGGRIVAPLNEMNYRRQGAKDALVAVGWRDYGGKHHESTFTKFYQSYVLPAKFGVDKRRVHLSAQIRIGETTRGAALDELARPVYAPHDLARDRRYVLKKLGFTDAEFDAMMQSPPVPHAAYRTDQRVMAPLLKWGRRLVKVR